MAFDPIELMSPRERLAYNINMRTRAADGGAAPLPSAYATPSGKDFFGEDGLQFSDLLDILNPLQQLPLISMAYRAITGDEISAGARIAGGALYGGPIGLAMGVVDAAVADASGGKDLGAIALNAVTGDETTVATPGSEHVDPSVASIPALNNVAPAAGGRRRRACRAVMGLFRGTVGRRDAGCARRRKRLHIIASHHARRGAGHSHGEYERDPRTHRGSDLALAVFRRPSRQNRRGVAECGGDQ
ncbi:MAG: hypothetical protein EXQ99_02165 [Alphaproteobacteria bacterium]|nr:hypothetical protein [Alphaproteobacteria bacterium]